MPEPERRGIPSKRTRFCCPIIEGTPFYPDWCRVPFSPIASEVSCPRRVVVLGSTGSVGTSCLEVIAGLPQRLTAVGLSAHRNRETLLAQAHAHRPRWVVLTDS